MNTLENKIAIVTGASKGIGAAIAKGLAVAGASVTVNYSSDKDGADRTVAEIKSKGGNAIAVAGDVSKAADVARLFAETRKAFGAPNIVVNNAGVFSFEPVSEITEDEFRRHFGINVLGPILMTQQALKYFPDTGGSIINISSIASKNPPPNAIVYTASKGAVDTLTKSLARELGARKIRVNAVAPGHTITEGVRSAGLEGSDVQKMMIANTPLGRAGEPDDIVPAVVFLASDDAAWITGERISASGGLH
jgi:3-oxoacyl-[acyl-carrier protein] reductase